jgi:uncharacterized membrane protein (DUF485 family)
MSSAEAAFQAVTRRRSRVATLLTLAMVAIYFGFILLVAYNKPLLGKLVTPGLSLGVLLGALVIVLTWVLTWIYVRWTNVHYDRALHEMREGSRQ